MSKNLNKARKAKCDEFYTQLSDIEGELGHYKEHFRGKVVYCNCDDPRVSNFFHYFSYNFESLGLKRLIATCYKNNDADLFSRNKAERSISLEYTGDKNNNNVPDIEEIGIKYLKGDGDFRSEESIKFLKEADIVVTNPPFSLFREYVAQLMEYEKKFIIIGSMNAITYKETFPLLQENRMWIGIRSGACLYGVPDDYTGKVVLKDGRRYSKMGNTLWYTNLEHKKRKQELTLYKKYNPVDYPKYDNYDAIEVSKTKDIPIDYSGLMGVPITFMEKYNPDQFEILGLDVSLTKELHGKISRFYLNGNILYARIIIKRGGKTL